MSSEPLNSAMLASMNEHGNSSNHGSENHPVNHAQGHDQGWNTPIFTNNLEIFPGAKEGSLDSIIAGLSGSVNSFIDSVIQNNAFGQNIVGAFDGTISPGGIAHEGLDFNVSGDNRAHNISFIGKHKIEEVGFAVGKS